MTLGTRRVGFCAFVTQHCGEGYLECIRDFRSVQEKQGSCQVSDFGGAGLGFLVQSRPRELAGLAAGKAGVVWGMCRSFGAVRRATDCRLRVLTGCQSR